ncbi:hypothetical protein GGR53DRAFT_511111 [Hypoxylon sp. FL1150]|nr:hypothetical protein GGR53DRAFT_511111 [Hypoxylon sp. FL1150]
MAAESGDWTSRPSIQSRYSQRSMRRGVVSSPASTTHRRIGSDGVSLISQSLVDDAAGFTRPSTVSPEPQSWLHLGATRPAGLSTSPPTNWSEDGDLGLTMSPNFASGFSQTHHKPEQFQNSPAPTAQANRPKPVPIQFEDVPADFYSPPGSSQPMFSPRGRFQHSRTDSRANLLATPSTTAWRSPRTPPPYSAMLPPSRRWWHWRPAWVMYLSFLFGICCAIGHHIFYKTLSGRPAENQLAMLRYGAVLAFAAKAGLVAAIVIAFKQRIWMTVRSKFLSVAALDSLFAATEDISALLNLEIYKRATVAMLLALFVWLTPIVIILTSNTLLVTPALRVDTTQCLGIRSLNFDNEERESFRDPTRVDGITGLSVNLWNTTSTNLSSPDWFDYYTAPSDQFAQTASIAAYLGHAVMRTNAAVDICGSGWNCTYEVNFIAPAYKCSELASGVGSEIKPLGDQKPPDGFSTKLLIPEGNYSYYAYTSGGDYGMQMNDTWPGGIPKINPPFPETLGAFRTEPVIWIGYSTRAKSDERGPFNSSMPGWNEAYIPKVIACENYEAAYTVKFNLTSGQQTTNVTERTFLHRVVDTTWIQDEEANDGTVDNTTATPKSNYVYPRDVSHYRRVASFHSMGSLLRYFVNGTVDSQNVDKPNANTKAIQTKLLDPHRDYFTTLPTMVGLVQDFYEDIMFSLFSNPQFVSVVWAAKPDNASGIVAGDETTGYPCERSRLENVFSYHERDLWIVYSLAILLALCAVVSGTLAILENEGLLRSTRFSSIVAATRGPALEKLGWVGPENQGSLPRDVRNLKVGYGIVHRPSGGLGVLQEDTSYPEAVPWNGGDVRYGFGLEGDVRQTKSEASLFRQRSTTLR